MSAKQHLHMALSAGTVEIWRGVAVELGYVSIGGPMSREGSPTQLFNALAGGEVDPVDLAQAIYKVRMTKGNELPEEVKHEK